MADHLKFPIIPDLSCENGSFGFSVSPATAYEGFRVTASSAYLTGDLSNLDIQTDKKVARVKFEGKKAVGVELVSSEECKHFAAPLFPPNRDRIDHLSRRRLQ